MSGNQSILLSILIPVRNEGVNLKIMLKILRATVEVPCEVVVVCDSPDDDSIPIVKACQKDFPNLQLVENTYGKGIPNALQAGVEAAKGEWILIFAADEIGPVLTIQEFLDLAAQGCEFVSGTRYSHGGRRLGGSKIGGILSLSANFFFRFLSGTRFTDCTTGIKVFRRSIFPKFALSATSTGWSVAFEMAIKAQLMNLKLGEVPIISIDRLYGGKSTFRLWAWVVDYLRWFLWGVWQLRRHSGGAKEVMVKIPKQHLR